MTVLSTPGAPPGQPPEQLKAMNDRVAHLARLGVEAIED